MTKRISEFRKGVKGKTVKKSFLKVDTTIPVIAQPTPKIESTPEKENEKILIRWQGSIVPATITDRSSCGKFVRLTINGKSMDWKELSKVDIVSNVK